MIHYRVTRDRFAGRGVEEVYGLGADGGEEDECGRVVGGGVGVPEVGRDWRRLREEGRREEGEVGGVVG
jgi:hypothetical protein